MSYGVGAMMRGTRFAKSPVIKRALISTLEVKFHSSKPLENNVIIISHLFAEGHLWSFVRSQDFPSTIGRIKDEFYE
jgi:hypothetical protein